LNQAMKIASSVVDFDLANHPERIQLLMRPAYDVKDISYDPETINEHINSLLNPIAKAIPEGAYTGETLEQSQQKVLDNINKGLEDSEFVRWAFANYVWLQIEDEVQRETKHFEILQKYVALLTDNNE